MVLAYMLDAIKHVSVRVAASPFLTGAYEKQVYIGCSLTVGVSNKWFNINLVARWYVQMHHRA